ncbi:MAG: RES family NAD+ phosphorylase [Pseudomonadota bacterium]|nr:RES family NAD+ phosphorylase [Pseudomonadota bacterium]
MNAVRWEKARFWRILSPRFAGAPLSGEGAARHGGRWNRPGQPALYLPCDIETAFAEYQQEMGVRPGTFVAYEVSNATIVDLADAATRRSVGLKAADLTAPWKPIAWVDKLEPATWRAADRLLAASDGARVPSAAWPGGFNLVLWRWNQADGARVSFHDPLNDLAP